MKASKKWLALTFIFLMTLGISSCGFHLRGQNVLPPGLRCIQLLSGTPYADFESTLRRSLIRLGIRVTRTESAPVILNIINTSLTQDVPTIGGSNQARVLVFYYQVNFQILDSCHNVLIPPKCITTSETLIVNAGTALESTNQLDILIQQMQIETSHMIINILNSPQVRCVLKCG